MTAIGDTMLVTALRDGDGDLLLISWRLEPDGTFVAAAATAKIKPAR